MAANSNAYMKNEVKKAFEKRRQVGSGMPTHCGKKRRAHHKSIEQGKYLPNAAAASSDACESKPKSRGKIDRENCKSMLLETFAALLDVTSDMNDMVMTLQQALMDFHEDNITRNIFERVKTCLSVCCGAIGTLKTAFPILLGSLNARDTRIYHDLELSLVDLELNPFLLHNLPSKRPECVSRVTDQKASSQSSRAFATQSMCDTLSMCCSVCVELISLVYIDTDARSFKCTSVFDKLYSIILRNLVVHTRQRQYSLIATSSNWAAATEFYQLHLI